MELKTAGSLFAGVGGFEKAMGGDLDFLWSNEIDPYAWETFKANHDSVLVRGDIRHIVKLPEVDVLVGGFPCQPFSIAGERKGFEDTRGTLFFDMARIIKMTKPKAILLENVANIASHDKGRTLKVIMETVKELGYHAHTAILNTSTHTMIPQNRRRWFLVGFREEKGYKFPDPVQFTFKVHNLVENFPAEKYYLKPGGIFHDRVMDFADDKEAVYIRKRGGVRKQANHVTPTLTTHMGTGGNNVPVIFHNGRLRKLTPTDCFRLQGFYDIKLPEIPDYQLYKQAGNMVTVPLIRRIWENMKEVS